MSKRIYLDYASITPVDKKISKEVFRISKKYHANPSSIYMEGVKSLSFLDDCRKRISKILEVHSDEIIFTSGGTESNNLAIEGVVNAYSGTPHVISSTIEHPSVRELLFSLEREGKIELSLISPNEDGIIESVKVFDLLKPNTLLVSIMYANNEIGTIMPLTDIAKKMREYKKREGRTEFDMPFLHTDASQAASYLSLRIPSLHADLMTLDGGKIYGPRGVGMLFGKRIVPFKSITKGGSQESGRRSGTENLPSIAGFTLALEMVDKKKEKEFKRIENLRNLLLVYLKSSDIGDDFTINGTMAIGQRLPNNLNICIPHVDAEFLVLTLDVLGVCVSSVTSCRTLSEDSYSYVVREVSGEDCSKSSLRISLGKWTNKRDILKAGRKIVEAINRAM